MNDSRDKRTGQYAHSNLDQRCVCGHTLGVHSAEVAEGMRPCFAGDFSAEDNGDPNGCECERFRKARKK